MKRCTHCNIDKGESGFSIRKASKDGLDHQCKKCKRAYDNSRLPSIRGCKAVYKKQFRKDNKVRLNKEARAARAMHPEKFRARDAVKYALRCERLFKKPCPCGEIKVEAHHPDYEKPLDVVWLCRKCHGKLC